MYRSCGRKYRYSTPEYRYIELVYRSWRPLPEHNVLFTFASAILLNFNKYLLSRRPMIAKLWYLLPLLFSHMAPWSPVPEPDQKALSADDSLDLKIGQMILIGLDDRKELKETDPLIRDVREGKVGSIIIFEKNISPTRSAEKLTKLVADIQQHAAIPLFVTIDEEGGRVHRMKEKYGFPPMPSAAYLGRLDNPDTTYFYNRRLAAAMAAVGINLNFAPDVDLAVNPDNPVIARLDRSFSADPDKVTRHALQCIRGHHDEGVKTILKHFPGHGSSTTDSHFGIVDVTNTWQGKELMPYKKIIHSGQCDAVMTAHIINRAWDGSGLPATLSEKVVTGLLRGELGFEGVVFSDDMQMHAISKAYGFENAVKKAINAGVDILLFGNNVPASDKVTAGQIHATIKRLVRSGAIPEARIHESYARIMTLKERRFNPSESSK